MHVEVLGPNHLRLLDEDEPPGPQLQSSQGLLAGQLDDSGEIGNDGPLSNANVCSSKETVDAATSETQRKVSGNSDIEMG
ncbi:hypothetical protein SESBI_36663 [Sesbania bispinosa]|nr:hypothetical protein SESBI_36663 [Sesbania bispinosa]